MFNLPGVPEMALIFFVALIVFGPKRLPEIARSLGKFMRNFQSETNRALSDLKAGFEPATHGIFDTPDEGSEQPAQTQTIIPSEEMKRTRSRASTKRGTSSTSRSRAKSNAKSSRAKPAAPSSRAKPAAKRPASATRSAPRKRPPATKTTKKR